MKKLFLIIKQFGPGWIVFRIWKIVSEKLGYWQRRVPSASWQEIGENYGVADRFDDSQQLKQELDSNQVKFFHDTQSATESGFELTDRGSYNEQKASQLDDILSGKFRFFDHPWPQRSTIPDWYKNPLTGDRAPSDSHFSRINEYGYGDIKAIWEINRFGFVFDLARCFGATKDPRCGERFWELFHGWTESNPPFEGINWKCGQESGLRMFAVVFGYFTFRDHPKFDGKMASRLTDYLAATGIRIERHIAYAISQKNNHGMSEAVALWTLGVLFPNLACSKRWRKRGLEAMVLLCDELVYSDGGFSQNSSNYHRVLLHLMAWMVQIAKLNDIQLPDAITTKFKLATQFLFQIMDAETGRVPRYGNDDGANLFPLSDCGYQDYRPIVQLCIALIDGVRQFDSGSWNEDLFWFGVHTSAPTEERPAWKQTSLTRMPDAGRHVLRGESSFAFLQAGNFIHRPCQMDMLHVDLWADGNNIAVDPGTYSYNGEDNWRDIPFSRSDIHNTVTVDNQSFAHRIGKYLFVPWPKSNLAAFNESEDRSGYLLAHRKIKFGLTDPVTHWRAVCKTTDQSWAVIDYLESPAEHLYRLHWLLGGDCNAGDVPEHLQLRFPSGAEYNVFTSCTTPITFEDVIGDDATGRGLYAPAYLQRTQAHSRSALTKANTTRFATFFGPSAENTKLLSEQFAAREWPKAELSQAAIELDLAHILQRTDSVETL